MPRTYDPIASTTLASPAASITLSSISAAYTDLVLVLDGTFSPGANLYATYNGGGGSIYSNVEIRADGGSVTSGRTSDQMQLRLNQFTSSTKSTFRLHIMSYANTSAFKTYLCDFGSAQSRLEKSVGTWRSTSAINQITLYLSAGNFASGFTASLFGIKAA